MKFWDASALIPLCLEEPWTALLIQVLAEDGLMIVWWGSMVECWSAFARLRREGIFDTNDEAPARAMLARLATAWTEVLPSQAVRDHAAHALQVHPLRAEMPCNWPPPSSGAKASREASFLSASIIGYGPPPSVKVFCSSRLRKPYKRLRHLSVSKGRVPSQYP